MGTLSNSEDTDEISASGSISSGSALFAKSKNNLQRKKHIFLGSYNL